MHLELRHEVECLVEVLLAQHLELDEVVVVLDLDEPAVGQVPQAVDARLAGELDRPMRYIETCHGCYSMEKVGKLIYDDNIDKWTYWKCAVTLPGRPEEVLEPDDVSVEVRDIRVVDGPRYVVREEVDDLVVPVEDLEDGLLPLSDLPQKKGYSSLFN